MQIGLLVSFAILIFAIIGLEFYTGALHKTCYSVSDLGKVQDRLTWPDLTSPDEIVRDGLNTIVPCNAESPDSAPAGAFLCNSTEAICLEKWRVSDSWPSWLSLTPQPNPGTKLWNYLLRQHLVRHADGLPVHHHGGVDQHVVLGECSLGPGQRDEIWFSTSLCQYSLYKLSPKNEYLCEKVLQLLATNTVCPNIWLQYLTKLNKTKTQ